MQIPEKSFYMPLQSTFIRFSFLCFTFAEMSKESYCVIKNKVTTNIIRV